MSRRLYAFCPPALLAFALEDGLPLIAKILRLDRILSVSEWDHIQTKWGSPIPDLDFLGGVVICPRCFSEVLGAAETVFCCRCTLVCSEGREFVAGFWGELQNAYESESPRPFPIEEAALAALESGGSVPPMSEAVRAWFEVRRLEFQKLIEEAANS